jgi:hypothetical protein
MQTVLVVVQHHQQHVSMYAETSANRPIEYSRGHITVVDRAGLEARTCECYAVVKKESDRLLPKGIVS